MLSALCVAGCSSEVYVRDGVTDGDTFYLAERALADNDPVLQSWVGYSLSRSTCQLQMGGENPARANSYECELKARRLLVDTWFEMRADDPAVADTYLDDLAAVAANGYLDAYVAHYYRKRDWQIPAHVRTTGFEKWARREIPGHRPQTRIIGSWNYSRNVASF
jgi:hypothetical protein